MSALAELSMADSGRLPAAMRPRAAAAYRPDVDGLRAVAVLAVVVFHLFPSALPGGFVGVDVFFVISGYLISRILLEELHADRFSLVGFYARRIRRIFPALALVLAASLAFGWTALVSAEYEELGSHVAAGAAFVSNLVLWGESGYWDKAAIAKPLLHLWSLGVEEQFYLLWPVLLWWAWRVRSNVFALTVFIALLSFAANLATTWRAPVEAFYSPLTRFWELMVGAALAYREVHGPTRAAAAGRWASIASAAGAALLVLGLIFAREKNFPGLQALLPTAGAALLIHAGARAPLNRALLSRPPMVAVGLISYPLYLWHWPLLSFARIVHGEPGAPMRVTLLLTAVALAALTYWMLERPLKAPGKRASVTLLLVAVMAFVGVAGLRVQEQKGLEQRAVVQANARLESARAAPYPPFAGRCAFLPDVPKGLFACHVDVRESPRFALVGDSKAGALFPGLFATARSGGTWMAASSGAAGPLLPVLGTSPVYSYVDARAVDAALRTIEHTPSVEVVVIAAATRALFGLADDRSIADLPRSRNYQAAFDGLDATVSRLLAAGKRVVLLVDNPTLPGTEDCVGRTTASTFFNRLLAVPPNPACRITLAHHLELSRPYRDLLAAVRDRHPGWVSVFDPLALLCDGGVCAPSRDGRLLYGITDHLSYEGSVLVGRALNEHLHPTRPPARTD